MIATALLLGLMGSLHCLGMCSPLAMAVTNRTGQALVNRFVYNAGRILTYGSYGALISTVGYFLPLGRYQIAISVVLGIVLIFIGIGGFTQTSFLRLAPVLASFSTFLKNIFSAVLKTKSRFSVFLLGSINGFLPCGLSFVALSYCITLAGPLDGFAFMVWFGIGTLPVMLGFTSIFQWTANYFQMSIAKITTSMLIVSGCLLIVRVFIVHLPDARLLYGGMIEAICR